MIRRLILYRPITPDEARAAAAWSEKLGDERLTLDYRVSPVPMRILMFDAVRIQGKKRRASRRILDDPAAPAEAALRDAMASGDVVFNVYTGREDDRSSAWSGTDAVFTVALPEGEAVAYFLRSSRGIAPGIARSCMWRAHAGTLAVKSGVLPAVCQSARFLFFKRRPANIRYHEERVIAFAMDRLAEVAVGRV
ncbi:MAG TPA: hypothetical protein VN663_22805 [Ramlibacter sp.]|nr:hypothetical protein [Ramlibacter sp.]